MNDRRFKMPPLEWIRAFEAAARCGSFTAAAAEAGLTQSAISQRISQLEKELGTTLFYRRARAIELTVEGETWLPHVRTALRNLRDSSEALFGSGRGQMTISASQSIIDLWLRPRLQGLGRIAKGQLTIQSMVIGAHEAALDDIIRIRYGTGDWPHDHKLQLFDEQIAPLASPDLAKSVGHWTDWPRIACSGPRPGWNTWATRFGISTTPVPQLRFDTFLSALGAARAGLGVVLASLPLCDEDIRAGRLVRLSDEALQHHESYWAIAGPDAIARTQWNELAKALA
ncbi:LysR family transcriptional regulator [Pseudophaeobacter flagellatus]|uniref:LysR family transcriptional regulator n=1 Tax=Pseudophaeobacter flagellatus TaxID=2899119 RepID=UPI001E5A6845|nr:LysR family transcriptional regulator [Pseudophaeobacter flagellatus]MCD9150112.1 LysR family transcriptional regulator [Pseudophaeobacter flagellatus]